jgi:phosphate:Na+ symporter
MTLDALISMLAGLGLFFIGVKGISVNMGQMAGRSLRRWVALSTGNPLMGAIFGILSGALTQSTNAVTVILASLAKADAITVREAMPILAWSNVGTAALVMVAVVDIHLFVLSLIAAVGICFFLNLDRSPRLRLLISTLYAVAMLFLGLELMRRGAQEMRLLGWARLFLETAARWWPTALLAGAALAQLAQSSATVTVIVIAMASAGLLHPEAAAMLVFGASIGSGIATYLVGLKIPGRPRQLAILQALFKMLGVLLLLPLYAALQLSGGKFFGAAWQTSSPAHQVAFVYLACQLAAALVQILFGHPLRLLLDAKMAPSLEENFSKPRYLYDEALSEPETALALVDREQARIFALLPCHLGIMLHLEGAETQLTRDSILPISVAVGRKIDQFLNNLTDTGASRSLLERAADRKGCNSLLLSLHESLHELGEALTRPFEAETLQTLASNINEGLGALLLTAESAVRTREPDEVRILLQLSSDRSKLVDNLRRRVMAAEGGLASADQARLYAITSLLERVVWMFRRYAGNLLEQTAPEVSTGLVADPVIVSS